MEDVLTDIQKIKENLECVAFLVSKGSSEREAHGKIVETLVVLAQLENKIKNYSSHCLSVNREVGIPKFQKEKSHSTILPAKDDASQEVEKVTRRLPKWFRNPSQNNSQILINYLKLFKQNESIDIQSLKNQCGSVKDFYGNYNQMKNFGEKNHGKVFEEKDGFVMLWEPVKDIILALYNEK